MRKLFVNNLIGGIATALGGFVINGMINYFSNPTNKAKMKRSIERTKTKFKIKKLRAVD